MLKLDAGNVYEERLDALKKSRTALKSYMLAKFQMEDWHGVADAANDLREIEAEMRAIRWATAL